MSAGDLLVLVATVIGASDGGIEIDRGLIDGLEPGDRATVYYELSVDDRPRRIDVGRTRVESASEERAVLEVVGEFDARIGYKAELRVPVERALTLLTREPGSPRPAPTPPKAPRRDVVVAPQPDLPQAEVIEIDGGSYEVGLPADRATFYNQQPRFVVEIGAFRLDQRPVHRGEFERLFGSLEGGTARFATDVTFEEAASYCAAVGRRLPTEFEWEIGMSRLPAGSWPGIFEWTDAWYGPYPGNERSEPEYGETYRVLRGGPDSGSDRAFRRRYLEPLERHHRLGFRCAEGARASG